MKFNDIALACLIPGDFLADESTKNTHEDKKFTENMKNSTHEITY